MVNSDLQRILHIKYYCEEIETFLDRIDHDYDKFLEDNLVIRATSMCILQIGENSSGLSDEYRKRTAGAVDWRSIRGMRTSTTFIIGVRFRSSASCILAIFAIFLSSGTSKPCMVP